ncbi:hypothetical protein MRB53_020593 [Persea americana]|uniref:Uncharacterized protein n=1 Tax=Persea americana TaxID=3435 RepID=A0ACC2L1L7_PERAE|nr:hypothetical protein MRB53_020593 [Persea americana]
MRVTIELFDHEENSLPDINANTNAEISGSDHTQPRVSGSHQDNNALGRSSHGLIPRRYFSIEGESYAYITFDEDEPQIFQKALKSWNSKEWITAMNDEIISMRKN